MRKRVYLLMISTLSVFSLMACAGTESSGVIVEYGQTTVTVGAADTVVAKSAGAKYRRCTRADVIDLTIGLMCTYPEGPSDLERQAYLSRQLEEMEIDPDTYRDMFNRAASEGDFTDRVADGMVTVCPKRIEEMILAAH